MTMCLWLLVAISIELVKICALEPECTKSSECVPCEDGDEICVEGMKQQYICEKPEGEGSYTIYKKCEDLLQSDEGKDNSFWFFEIGMTIVLALSVYVFIRRRRILKRLKENRFVKMVS
mmetsp:Transcript_7270/g.11061  ORF Transcript_7270/g.11061 Transcript_7270/m.11061 type:complete len:119 (+) Transcript_7270:28-384(+)